MGPFEKLLRKLGYVKLDRYGYYLTPEGRIISAHDRSPDAAADSYEVGGTPQVAKPSGPITWPGKPAPATSAATAVASAPAPALPVSQPVLQAQQIIASISTTLDRADAAGVATAPPVIESSSQDDDDGDEWEWQMAMARARAAADETTAAAAAPVPAPVVVQVPVPVAVPVVATKPMPMPLPAPVAAPAPRVSPAPAPRTMSTTSSIPRVTQVGAPSRPIARPESMSPPSPMAPVIRSTPRPTPVRTSTPAPRPIASRPARPIADDTETTQITDATRAIGDETTRTTPVDEETTRTHAAPPPPKKVMSARTTVIPIPGMPVHDQTRPMQLEPVVRPRVTAAPPPVPAAAKVVAPRRFPRGTDQVVPQPAATAPAPARALDAARPANDDGAPLPRFTKRFASH